jgi:hypothetical protein
MELMETENAFKPVVIDLPKLFGCLLPVGVRGTRILSLLHVLLHPLTEISQRIHERGDELFYLAHAEGSVIGLRHHIRKVFGVDCSILEETGGKPDFRVMVLDRKAVDFERMRDFIEQYKIAGKSFVLQWSPLVAAFFDHVCERVNYSAAFFDHACERVNYSASFTGHVCERVEVLYLLADVVQQASETVTVTLGTHNGKAVKSGVTVRGEVYFRDENNNNAFSRLPFNIGIKTGSSSQTASLVKLAGHAYGTGIESVSPSMDEYYAYRPDESETPTPTPEPE